jgi:hypothetical protein
MSRYTGHPAWQNPACSIDPAILSLALTCTHAGYHLQLLINISFNQKVKLTGEGLEMRSTYWHAAHKSGSLIPVFML